jgi:hypothetical protein
MTLDVTGVMLRARDSAHSHKQSPETNFSGDCLVVLNRNPLKVKSIAIEITFRLWGLAENALAPEIRLRPDHIDLG